jgi:hypothetical protein
MKIVLVILAFVAGIVAGSIGTRALSSRYEFMHGSGDFSSVIFRCDKITGQTEMSLGSTGWQIITNKPQIHNWSP